MCTGHVDLAQSIYEGSEIDGRLIQILDRAVGVLAGQPLVDRPVEWIALGRLPHHQLDRNSERQMRPQLLQPFGLLRCLLGSPPDSRQPSGQFVAEPIDVVIGSVSHDFSISSACILVEPIVVIIHKLR